MSLVPGTRIGPYEVIAKIGEGGMGEVYRATDTKLNRDAALKVLPESLTADPERNRQGTVLGAVGDVRRSYGAGLSPRISPDGTRVAIQVRDAVQQPEGIWVIELERNLPIRVHAPGPTGLDAGQYPQWSSDGHHLAFTVQIDGVVGIYRKAATGLGAPELLMRAGADTGGAFAGDWSRDGRYLLYRKRGDRTRGDVWALPLTGDRRPFPVLSTEFDESSPQLSPDGRWIAYRSDASGTLEIYVQSFTTEGRAGGERVRISTGGGRQPRFRGDGRELFYLADDGQLMAVAINGNGASAEHGEPKALFRARTLPRDDIGTTEEYDVSQDGQRFLIGAVLDGGAPPAPTVVLNWTAGLKH